MRTRTTTRGTLRTGLLVVPAVVLAVVLAGCGTGGAGDAGGTRAAVPQATPSAAGGGSGGAEAADGPGSTGRPGVPPVELPPGDPGLDAPAMADPGTSAPEPHGHEEPLRRVPGQALLDAGTVATVLGGSWRAHRGSAVECTVPDGALGVRTGAYESGDDQVLQTVTTHHDAADADAAVSALAGALDRCGWTVGPDPRVGSASVTAEDGAGRVLTAVSVEGVGVVLVGSAGVARNRGRWSSLVDMALGSSCPAAPDGCH